jgi:hypothetical protein
VNQTIPEGDDRVGIGDPLLDTWLLPEEIVQRFSDDLKLPLDGGTKHGIETILIIGSSRSELYDVVHRFCNIVYTSVPHATA